MIRTTGALRWSDYHAEWVHRAEGMEVTCDHDGCKATATPTGWETNGAHIEEVYGVDGWDLDKNDHRCQAHQLTRKHNCDFCGAWMTMTLAEAKERKWLCDDCRPVPLLTDAQMQRVGGEG
jgi:hypothetical protein